MTSPATTRADPSTRPRLDLRTMFAPTSVAVVGASNDPGRHNGRPIANLLRTGFSGRILPVNPRHQVIQGLPCFASVQALGEQVDVAYITVRAELVEQAVTDCAAAGVPTIIVCSSGFAEDGEAGAVQQARLREVAWAHGSRVVGPNCIGVVSVPENVASCTTLNITTTFTPGDITIVSQSGGMATNLFNRAQGAGVGVRALVSLGNEADVDLADVVEQLADDEATRVIFLYVEQLREFARFRRAVGRARARGKHVLALKVGRSAAGARSALSHTGAMAGSYEVFRDAMESIGVVVVESINEMVDAAGAAQRLAPLAGNRLLVVSPSGGECGYVADLAEAAGLVLPEMPAALRDEVAALMRFGTPGNPLDLTGQVIGDADMVAAVFKAIETSHAFDAVLVALPTWGEFDSRRLMPPILGAAMRSGVPMAVSAWQSANLTEYRDELIRGTPVAQFEDADRAVRALAVLARMGATAATVGSAGASTDGSPENLAAARIPVPAASLGNEAAAKSFLGGLGVPVSREATVQTYEEALERAVELGWPVVVKGLVEGLGHKSELGLVRLGLRDPHALAGAIEAVTSAASNHGVRLDGYLVARQYAGLEMIVGGVNDAEFGPLLMVGAGGVLTEVMDDKTFLLCPASREDVEAALARLRVGRVLAGHRGTSYDVGSFVTLVSDFSRTFAALDGVQQADLNPVIVAATPGGGSWVVDALMTTD